MKSLLGLGKYLFAIPFIVFGLFHFMGAKDMAGIVPIPGGEIWVYITGVAHIAAAVAILIGKMDKLAAALLGLMLLIFALSIHLPGVIESGGENQAAMSAFLKDTMLAGAAWIYAAYVAKDSAVIG
ncbi:MAG: DoxX family membrane protein [Bacteroidetes bacterium]|nr:DoxX family membrane protein [Bacteroidota bacterium]